LAKQNGCRMNGQMSGLGPKPELMSTATARVAVIAAAGYVHRERGRAVPIGLVEWTRSVPLIPSATHRFEAEQVQDVLHGHFGAERLEVNP
jgi:hypothetical protein